MDFQKFFEGDMYDAYKFMGAHPEKDGVVFRTYAPSAEKVCIVCLNDVYNKFATNGSFILFKCNVH